MKSVDAMRQNIRSLKMCKYNPDISRLAAIDSYGLEIGKSFSHIQKFKVF